MLGVGAVGQHTAVGHEQQRLGVVGRVELLVGEQGAVETPGLGERQQRAHQGRDRSVVDGGHRDRVGRCDLGLGERVRVCRRPRRLLLGAGAQVRGDGVGQGGLAVQGAQRGQDEVLGRVDGDVDPEPLLQADEGDVLPGVVVVVGRPVGGQATRAVQLADGGGDEVDGVRARP